MGGATGSANRGRSPLEDVVEGREMVEDIEEFCLRCSELLELAEMSISSEELI
jgi:hypothetical protein